MIDGAEPPEPPAMSTFPFSVIVPVHNEAAVISDGARHLLDGLPVGTELVYVCNGCSDESAAILMRVVGSRGLIIERAKAGKAAAIRESERHVRAFPRFYVDADVRITGHDLVRLAARLESGGLELVSPLIDIDHSGSSRPARALAKMWLTLPHGRSGAFHHVLGISKVGRGRWGDFPDVMADDAFIEAHIPLEKKAIDSTVRVTVRFPRTIWSNVRVRSRWLRGNRQLERLGVKVIRQNSQLSTLVHTTLSRKGFSAGALYIAVRLFAIPVSYFDELVGRPWYSDQTSRHVPPS